MTDSNNSVIKDREQFCGKSQMRSADFSFQGGQVEKAKQKYEESLPHGECVTLITLVDVWIYEVRLVAVLLSLSVSVAPSLSASVSVCLSLSLA